MTSTDQTEYLLLQNIAKDTRHFLKLRVSRLDFSHLSKYLQPSWRQQHTTCWAKIKANQNKQQRCFCQVAVKQRTRVFL